MLILRMCGGLGNQMFQYALYRTLRERGKEVYLEDTTMYEKAGRHDNRLESVFPLTYERGNNKDYNRLTDSSLLPWQRIRRKLFGRKEKLYQEKDAITFEQEIFQAEDCYAIGYWQSRRYFEEKIQITGRKYGGKQFATDTGSKKPTDKIKNRLGKDKRKLDDNSSLSSHRCYSSEFLYDSQ